MQTNIFFEPWVGNNFGKITSIFDKKVLILGDSHYCDDCENCGDRSQNSDCTNLTKNVIQDYLNPAHKANWKKTFSTFINSMFPETASPLQREQLLNSVAFYNYLQVAAGDNAYSTGKYDYTKAEYLDAFYEVLNLIEPDIVICWGDRVWNALPNNWNNYGEADKGPGIPIGNEVFKNYYSYPYKNKTILLIGVHHPCSGYSVNFYRSIFFSLFQN